MNNIFTEHPKQVGQDYWEHLGHAIGFSLKMFIASIVFLIHAFFPFLFTMTAGDMVIRLGKYLNKFREKTGVGVGRVLKD